MITYSERLHAHLIGRQGSRRDLNTPALILDHAAFTANIASMAAFARAAGVALRPHAKTHKSRDIACAQVAAGAVGICCAKLGEAEALAGPGDLSVHLTSPVVTAAGIARLIALNAAAPGLSVVADHPDAVDALARANRAGVPITVFVDIDPGNLRTGVTDAEAAIALAERIAGSATLRYGGVQFYCGSQQHIPGYRDRYDAIAQRTGRLSDIIAALTDRGLAPPVVTGGGTGSHRIDAALGVLTELQVGSYIFMDREYNDCDLAGDGSEPFMTALMVDATVVSANAPGLATVDAGLKAFATEAGPPPILAGASPGSSYRFMGDEHGGVIAPEGGPNTLRIGDRVTFAAPHCDPTVDRYDAYHVVDGDTLVAIWPVTARGRSA